MRKSNLSIPAIFLTFFLLLISAGCQPLSTPLPPLPTQTPGAPTATATATVVWFPPTATYTPLPMSTIVIAPTPDLSPQYSQVFLSDNFSDPTNWTQGRYPNGTVAAGMDELSLAVNQERGYISSLLQGVTLDNFYLEITASPSICRAGDEFGVLFRMKSAQDFYRFAINCNGQARVDRILGGTATAPQPLSYKGPIPRGAPSSSRLGIWAKDQEIRFYVNNEFLFSVRDTSLFSGSLGLFVRSATPDSVTVNFSDLVVYEVDE